jgi:hypothetical protein
MSRFGIASSNTDQARIFARAPRQVEITIAAAATSGTVTLSPAVIDSTRTLLLFNGMRSAETTFAIAEDAVRVEFTNSTTITAFTNTANASNSRIVRVTVVEFSPNAVQSVQYGTLTLNGVSSNTATITSVDTSRSAVTHLGATGNRTASQEYGYYECVLDLQNATTVRAVRSNPTDACTVSYAVVQFRSHIIQSLQQVSVAIGSTSATQDATISSVTTSNTILLWGGMNNAGGASISFLADRRPYTFLFNSTTVRSNRNQAGSTAGVTTRVAVIEFKTGVLKSVQRTQTTIAASNTTRDTTITSVNTELSLAMYLGLSNQTADSSFSDTYFTQELTSATNHRALRGASPTDVVDISFEIAEFNEYLPV